MKAVAVVAVALAVVAFASVEAIHINKLHAHQRGGPAVGPNQPCTVSLNGAAKQGTCWVKATCDKHKGTLLPEAGAATSTGKCPKGQQCCVVLPPPPPAPVTPTPVPVTPVPVTPVTPAPVTPVTPPAPASPLDIAPSAGKAPKLSWDNLLACSMPWADAPLTCRCRMRGGQPGCGMRCEMYGCVTGKASIEEGCMWSIEDEKCVNLRDPANQGIVAHAKSYTRDQVLAYYKEKDRLAALNPIRQPSGAPIREFQPITNPYAPVSRR